MSNLGKLWFELGIKDKTDKDIAEIRKNVEKRLKALGVDVKITPDLSELKNLKEVNVEIVTDTDKMVRNIQTALKAADISLDPSVSLNKAMQSITGQRALTIDTGALGRIEVLAKKQSSAIDQATGALLNQQKVYKEYSNTTMTATGSIKMMEAELNKLRDTYRSLSDVDRNSSIGKGLLQQINNADEALAKVNAQMANNSTLAKAMGTRYNGLQVQLAQVARELPNFAMSFSTGIISLSNNLPMLADEISRVRQEVALLRQSGQAATPVWKQVLSSLLSWQTALIVGITVLVAYSREIGEWINALIKGGDAAVYLAESQKKFNDLQKDASESVSKEISKLELLYNTTQNAALSIDARREAVEKLQQMYPDYLGKLSEEAILAGKASEAYSLLAESIKNAASLRLIEEQRAKASESLAKATEKEMNVQSKLNALMKELGAVSEQDLQNKAYDFSRNYGNYIRNLINDRNSAQKEQQSILDDAKKWSNKYASIFNKSVDKGQLDILFKDIPEVATFNKTLADLDRQLAMFAIDQDEYNKKVNEAKGALIAAADAANIGGSALEKLRDEYIAFNKVEISKKNQKIASKDAQETYKNKKAYLKADKALEDATLKSARNIEQARINVMEEGSAKQLAQLKLNFKKRMDEVKAQTDEYIKLVQEEELKAWRKSNPGKKDSDFTSQVVDIHTLPKKYQDLVVNQAQAADAEYENGQQKLLDNLLSKYQDFATRREVIEKQFNDGIATLNKRRTDENRETIDKAINEAKRKLKEAIKEINDEEVKSLQKDNPFFVRLFGDTSEMTRSQIKTLLDQAKQLRDYLKTTDSDNIGSILNIPADTLRRIKESPEALKALQDAVDKLTKKRDENSFDKLFSDIEKGLNKIKLGGKANIGEGIADIGNALQSIMPALKEFGQDLENIFGDEVGEYVQNITQLVGSVVKIGTGVGQALSGNILGGVTSVVSGIGQIVSSVRAANEQHKQALKKIMNDTIAQQREYNLLLLEQNLLYEKANTIFGTDTYGKAVKAAETFRKSIESLNEAIKDEGKYEGGYLLGGLFDLLAKEQRDYYNSLAGLANIQIKTGHEKGGIFGLGILGKGKDIYSSILDVYPDLIDKAGNFNRELAETILNTREMSEEDRNALQNMIDLSQKAEDALKSLNDYLTNIFGEFGNTLSDALVDAFKNGTDAAYSFVKSVSNMLEKLATQMAYSIFIAPALEEAQKDVQDVMKDTELSAEEKWEKAAAIVDAATDKIMANQDEYDNWLKDRQKYAKDKGYDIFTPDNEKQNGLSQSVKGITEDQANVLGSYLNAVRHDVSVKRSLLENIAGNLLPTMSITAQAQLQQLNAIAANTKANADAAIEIQKSSTAIQNALSSVIAQGKSGKAIRIQ